MRGPTRYDHTQRGWLHWLLVALAALFACSAIAVREEGPAPWLLAAVTAVMAVLAFCFAHLNVRDTGSELEIGFGPLRVFRRRVRYAEIATAEPGRSALIDGWGIHWTPGRGWTWNIRGFGCAELTLRDGRTLRIGTDEPDKLAAFVRSRVA